MNLKEAFRYQNKLQRLMKRRPGSSTDPPFSHPSAIIHDVSEQKTASRKRPGSD